MWLKSTSGPIKLEVNDQLAIFFVEETNAEQAIALLTQHSVALAKHQTLSLKTFAQNKVASLYFSSLRNFYLARDVLKKHNIKCFEDDIRPDERFLMERFITANVDFIGQQQSSKQLTNEYQQFNQVKCKKTKSPSDILLNMLSIDIECSMAGDLYSIGLYASDTDNVNKGEFKRVLMIGEAQTGTEASDNYIVWLNDEKALLLQFIEEIAQFQFKLRTFTFKYLFDVKA